MITELLYKWFGLEHKSCETCEVLREQLYKSEAERKELLHKLISPPQPEPVTVKEDAPIPITPQFVPWRVRQQLLEAEDRKQAQLIREKEKEIRESKSVAELEKELGVAE